MHSFGNTAKKWTSYSKPQFGVQRPRQTTSRTRTRHNRKGPIGCRRQSQGPGVGPQGPRLVPKGCLGCGKPWKDQDELKKHQASCLAKNKICLGCKHKGATPAHCICHGKGPVWKPKKAHMIRSPRNYRVRVPFDN